MYIFTLLYKLFKLFIVYSQIIYNIFCNIFIDILIYCNDCNNCDCQLTENKL